MEALSRVTIPLITRYISYPALDFPAWARQFIMDGKRAEVLMVVQSTKGHIWLHRKGEWRLPTGTLQQSEHPDAGVVRELQEEFGACLPVVRKLGLLCLKVDVPEITGSFTSHLYLVDGGEHVPVPVKDEGIDAWRAVAVEELYLEAKHLQALTAKDEPDGWRLPYWGTFRGLEHKLVADLLTGASASS